MNGIGPLRALLWAYAVAAAILLIPVVGKLVWDIPSADFLRDCPASAGGPFYLGMVSYLGIIAWGAAAALCFFAAAAERPGQERMRVFWTYAAVLTLLLLADDLLMLHEDVFPLRLGVPELAVYTFYAAAAGFYVLYFWRVLREANYLLLLAAFGWFALGLGVDHIEGTSTLTGILIIEDGAKLFGITTWLLFHAQFALARVRHAHS